MNGLTQVASFGYDNLGRRQSASLSGAAMNYGYDPISRLTSLNLDLAGTADDETLTFGYNPASQIVTRTSSNDAYANAMADVTRSYGVNGLNQYSSVAGSTQAYDPNDNLTSDGATSFSYDEENHLMAASGASTATLTYDPRGRLFQTAGGSAGTTQFLYDGDNLVAEYDGSGTLLRRYVPGPGQDEPLLWYEGAGITSPRGLLTDHHGSIVAVTDAAGNALAINGYDAWGVPNAGNLGRFGYTGQAWIPELGMYDYKARVYSPTLGRFLQTDPVGYQDQVNLYAYVGNDPLNNTDATGMYGRGTGFTDAQWKRFDRAQKATASAMENRATRLEARANKLDAKGKSGGDVLRESATNLRNGAASLRSDGSEGKTVSAESGANYSGCYPVSKGSAAFVPTDDTKKVVINLGSPVWNSISKLKWVAGHESLHSKGAGLRDQEGSNGFRAYKFGSPDQRAAFRELRGTVKGAENPDNLMDLVY